MHTLRKTYGWQDEYIIDAVEKRGMNWLNKQYRFCKEDEFLNWNIYLNIIPFARTPWSKAGSKSMIKAEKELRASLLETFTPWKNAHEERKKAYKKKYGIKPGEIAIVYGAGEKDIAKSIANKDTKIVKG